MEPNTKLNPIAGRKKTKHTTSLTNFYRPEDLRTRTVYHGETVNSVLEPSVGYGKGEGMVGVQVN